MLTQQTEDMLRQLRLFSLLEAIRDQARDPAYDAMPFMERLGHGLQNEILQRDNRRRERMFKLAKLKILARPEGVEFDPKRGLDRQYFNTLLTGAYQEHGQHVLITGAAGCGKTHIACALGYQAILKGVQALYWRLPTLLEALEVAQGDGSLFKERALITSAPILCLDDWGISGMSRRGRQDLLEIINDRPDNSALIITSQLPVDKWHEWIGEGTLADAILDRVVHSSHRIELRGESQRKLRAKR